MKKEQDIYNNKVYIITSFIMNLFVPDLAFLLMTSPLVIYILWPGNEWTLSAILILSLLVGPAITALFSTMQNLCRYKDIAPWHDYFKSYKTNFGQSLFITAVINFAVTVCYVDMGYFTSLNKNISYIFLGLIVVILMLCFYVYPILARFNLKTIDVFKIAVKVFVKKIYFTVTYAAIIIIMLWLIKITGIALIGLLVGVSIFCYIISLIQKKVIDEIEDQLKEEYNLK